MDYATKIELLKMATVLLMGINTGLAIGIELGKRHVLKKAEAKNENQNGTKGS